MAGDRGGGHRLPECSLGGVDGGKGGLPAHEYGGVGPDFTGSEEAGGAD